MKNKPKSRRIGFRTTGPVLFVIICLTLSGLAGLGRPSKAAAQEPVMSSGQTVYVPAYSYVYINEKAKRFNLITTLLIHNTDPEHALHLNSIQYFDGKGTMVQEYLPQPLKLGKLEAKEVLVKKPPLKQGSGACFVVVWRAEKPVSEPLMECIMIGTQGQQGISFRSTGHVIR